ncbi:uncharacterized protein METZ01_LOCUS214433, partial [marine metagenome]
AVNIHPRNCLRYTLKKDGLAISATVYFMIQYL